MAEAVVIIGERRKTLSLDRAAKPQLMAHEMAHELAHELARGWPTRCEKLWPFPLPTRTSVLMTHRNRSGNCWIANRMSLEICTQSDIRYQVDSDVLLLRLPASQAERLGLCKPHLD